MREVNVAIADDNERILDMLGEIIEQDHDLNLYYIGLRPGLQRGNHRDFSLTRRRNVI